jgi:hypothetical protein
LNSTSSGRHRCPRREEHRDYPVSVTREGVGGWHISTRTCREVWKVPAAPDAMHQPVVSSIPTLLISGSFDTLTSLAGAEAAAAKLSNATIISIPGIGHAVSPASPCAQVVVVSFLADPAARDTSCVGAFFKQRDAARHSTHRAQARFHPKLYLSLGEKRADGLIGSNNMSADEGKRTSTTVAHGPRQGRQQGDIDSQGRVCRGDAERV